MGGAKHEPVRMCVFCRRRLPKSAMKRFVLINGQVTEDVSQALPGRGAYCCLDEGCIERAGQDTKGVLKRALRSRDG